MSKPANYPKPDLSRLSTRVMKISSNRNDLEFDLLKWTAEIVKATHQPPENGNKAEVILMGTAKDSIDVLVQSTGMSVGGKQTVHAHFDWGRFPDGHWYVRHISFGLNLSAAQMQAARQQATKQRLSDAAELRNASHIDLRKVAFPAEDHVDTWLHDIRLGEQIIRSAIERAHEHARQDAKTLENPITPVDMALDMVGAGVGKGGAASHGAEKLAKAYEHIDHAKTGYENAKRWTGEPEQSTGDKALMTGLDVLSLVPGAGPFVKTMAGFFFEIAIASDAARVTRLRSRCYVFFVAGYVGQLALTLTGTPQRNLDKKYFDLGTRAAPAPNSPGSYRVQLALLQYAKEHYTAGGWGGLSFKERNWKFPDQYITNWSPEVLARSMGTQLHTRQNLIE
jgi:hypothetical protein